MPKRELPYLQKERSRHGVLSFYVRRGDGPRTRIRGEYGSADFLAAYHAAIAGQPIEPVVKAESQQTVRWLIDEYRKSADWLALSPGTRKLREHFFRQLVAKKAGQTSIGDKPATAINQASVIAGRDKRAATPHTARHFLDALRGLFGWAVAARKLTIDPTKDVKNLKRARSKTGIEAWTESDVATYLSHWPEGTKEHVWLNVLMYTGARRGDAVRFGSNMVSDGILHFKTEKSGFRVSVHLPILPPLEKALAAGGAGKTTWIAGAGGGPLTKESFGAMFGTAAKAAGIRKSAHRLRKFAATRAAQAGANIQALDAMFGWIGGEQASHYTFAANREELAIENAKKLLGRVKNPLQNPAL